MAKAKRARLRPGLAIGLVLLAAAAIAAAGGAAGQGEAPPAEAGAAEAAEAGAGEASETAAAAEPGAAETTAPADVAAAETAAEPPAPDYGWLSVVPPLVAIGLALIFKDVLISLFLGVFCGALIAYDWNPVAAFARSIDRFVAGALADPDHAKIVIFTTLLGGMVGLIGKSGGTRGIVERLARFATSSRRGQLVTWAMGVLVFFDDYANTLIVGSTMRPITDRLRVSREKLAYIVDSTAAPVASVMPISTWIGFEIGLIGTAIAGLGIGMNAYEVFLESIPYRFYPLLALVLGFTLAASGRDFGPMLRAERRAAATGELIAAGDTPLADFASPATEPPDGIPHRAINAVAPLLTMVAVTVAGLYASGVAALADEGQGRADFARLGTWLREVFSAADPYSTLLWGSLAAVVVAAALPLAQRLLTVKEAMTGMAEGFRSMLLALVVLVLAWSIQSVCDDLGTADYLVGLTSGVISPQWLPALVFVISAAVAFATGTSWGAMGILVPLVIPISHGLSLAEGYAVGGESYLIVLLGTVSSVLAGTVWGDHCSPISDTTILSSIASGSDHIAHTRTQLPYALGIGALGLVLGDVPTAVFGISPWISLAAGTAVIVGGVLWLGGRTDPPAGTAAA